MYQEGQLADNEPKDEGVNSLTPNSIADSSASEVPDHSNAQEQNECPISGEPIKIPVITNNGFTYDFISIAKWLCTRKNIDPVSGNRKVTTLIFNRAKRDDTISLSQEEKHTVAAYCIQLEMLHSKINISTIKTIEGIKDLIVMHQSENDQIPQNTPPAEAAQQQPINRITILRISMLLMAIFVIMIMLIECVILVSDLDIILKNLYRKLFKLDSPRDLALYRFENRCSSPFYMIPDMRSHSYYQGIVNSENHLTSLFDRYESLRDQRGLDGASISLFTNLYVQLNKFKNQGMAPRGQKVMRPRLALATQLGKVDFIRKLLKIGDSVDYENSCGQTALMMAASLGDVEIIDILLEGNANPDVQDKYGLTALHVAGFTGQTSAYKRLLRAGANPEIRDAYAMTAEMYAVESKHSMFLFQGLKLPNNDRSKVLTELFKRIKSQATSGLEHQPVILNSTHKMAQPTFFRQNHPICIQTLKNGDSRVEMLDELTASERQNANTKCGYPISPR